MTKIVPTIPYLMTYAQDLNGVLRRCRRTARRAPARLIDDKQCDSQLASSAVSCGLTRSDATRYQNILGGLPLSAASDSRSDA
eukprot:6203007-Pleurochrysis_carterae.AAC.1